MGAMSEEISGVLALLDDRTCHEIGNRKFWTGKLQGLDVVVVFSRWGKVAAAATATMLITTFAVDHILFIGVAGGADPDLDIGDVVVAEELIQHDMDASAIPIFARFEIPLLGRTRFAVHEPSKNKAVEAAKIFFERHFDQCVPESVRSSFSIAKPKILTGLIASGDRFVDNILFLDGLRAVLPDLLCVEMEGAAVAQVCYELSANLTVVRVISDRADHTASVEFPRFVSEVASVITTGVAMQLLRLMRAG